MRARIASLALAAAVLLAAPAQAVVTPVSDCRVPGGGPGLWWVYFGYVNTGSQQLIEYGDANIVVPGIGYTGQPTVFNQGSYPRVMKAEFNANAWPGVSWELAGASSFSTLANTPICSAGATGPASDLAPTSAKLNGLVEPDGADTAYYFNYGTTIAYGSATAERHSSSASGILVSEGLAGLAPSTTYHYRLVASSGTITTAGEDRTFTTPPTPVPPVDLALTHSLAPSSIMLGERLTSGLGVTNTSAESASSARVVAALPADAVFDPVNSSAGCTTAGATVTCALGGLAAGATKTAAVAFTPAKGGVLTVSAVALAAEPDPDAADNHAAATATVIEQAFPVPIAPAAPAPPGHAPAPPVAAASTAADLVLMRRGPRERVRVGRTVAVRFTARNRGPASATGVGLVHRLGEGLRLVSAKGPAGRCWGRMIIRCPLGTLKPGAVATVTLKLRPTRAGKLLDTATVTGDQPETQSADNTVAGALRARRPARRR